MRKIKKQKVIIFGLLACLISTLSVGVINAETTADQITLIDEGFESGIPSNWENTGWLDSLYGSSHTGSHHAFSWAKNDTLTTPILTFGENTELTFWYASEQNAMTLSVYIDAVSSANRIWTQTFSNQQYQKASIDLSMYLGNHQIIFVAGTSDMYGQLLDDILIITEDNGSSYPEGDINLDGMVNELDVWSLGTAVMYGTAIPDDADGDLNNDGVVNELDVWRLGTFVMYGS